MSKHYDEITFFPGVLYNKELLF